MVQGVGRAAGPAAEPPRRAKPACFGVAETAFGPRPPGKPAVRANRAEKRLTAGKYREPFELVWGYSSSLRTAIKASCGTSTLPS